MKFSDAVEQGLQLAIGIRRRDWNPGGFITVDLAGILYDPLERRAGIYAWSPTLADLTADDWANLCPTPNAGKEGSHTVSKKKSEPKPEPDVTNYAEGLPLPQMICPNCEADKGAGLGSELTVNLDQQIVTITCDECGWEIIADFRSEQVTQSVPK